MARENLNDLTAFTAVATSRSFTKAAAQLGVSSSALSHAMRALEERLGLRLLHRTTRSVSPTEAGERLLQGLTPHLLGIDATLADLNELRDRPTGTVRVTTNEHAALTILLPAVKRLARQYPDVRIELDVDNAFTDVVANRFDAGVRLGDHVEQDMVAVRIGPDLQMAVVGTPDYFARNPIPEHPNDLAHHNCISMRLPTYGDIMPWDFACGDKEVSIRPSGQLTFNSGSICIDAMLDGLGLGYSPVDLVSAHIRDGRLVRVLDLWCPAFAGYHLYYTSRRQHSAAFALLVESLRLKGPA